jgi:hypothetical protein
MSFRTNLSPVKLSIQCFNGPKTYQFRWFENYHVELPVTNEYFWAGNLVGFAGFAEKDFMKKGSEDKMIIRISGDPTNDYYVHFNRAVGFNSDTSEAANQVLVSKRITWQN